MTTAPGISVRQVSLSDHAAMVRVTAEASAAPVISPTDRRPFGKARPAVRGLRASIWRSISRFAVIANVRADAIAQALRDEAGRVQLTLHQRPERQAGHCIQELPAAGAEAGNGGPRADAGNPPADAEIGAGDYLIVMGQPGQLRRLEELMEEKVA